MSLIPTLAIALLLAIAAWRDIATRTIPDLATGLIALVGLALRATAGLPAIAISLMIGLLVFTLLALLAGRGLMGGGDVKLLASVSLGLGPLDAWHFIFATAMAGGLLGLLYMAAARLPLPALHAGTGAALLHRVAAVEAWRLRRRGPLPYGVAIAAGGLFVIFGAGGR